MSACNLMVFCRDVWRSDAAVWRRRRRGREFIKEPVAMPLLTFLIHVSSARAAFPPCPETAGKSRWKINATIFIPFFLVCEALPFYLFHASIAPRRLVSTFIFVLLETFVISARCFNVKLVCFELFLSINNIFPFKYLLYFGISIYVHNKNID